MQSSVVGLTRAQFWLLTLMGVAAVTVVIVNIVLMTGNADLRQEVNQRQQFINQGVKLSRLHNQLMQGLATLSARSSDDALREVLSRHGINYTVGPQPAGDAKQGAGQ